MHQHASPAPTAAAATGGTAALGAPPVAAATGGRCPSAPRRRLLLALGTVCVIVGVVGIPLPLLPTTPFLLLAAACYARADDRWLRRLRTHPVTGPWLRRYRPGEGLPRHAQAAAIGAMWCGLLLSAVLLPPALAGARLALVAAGLVGTAFLLTRKTRPGP